MQEDEIRWASAFLPSNVGSANGQFLPLAWVEPVTNIFVLGCRQLTVTRKRNESRIKRFAEMRFDLIF
jgi:hypothetical protein